MTDWIAIAEVVKAVGLKGEVKLYHLIDFHAPLLESAYLQWDDGSAARVTHQRSAKGGTAVALAAVRDRSAAEALVGRELGFARQSYLEPDFPRPPAGLPFRYLDREVVTAGGDAVGVVDEVRRYGAQVILVVPRGGREVLIPAVAPILRPDDGLVGPLVIDPPEGLIDAAGD
jgi:16S rRNA processing protein RimM